MNSDQSTKTQNRVSSLHNVVGNTPLFAIDFIYQGESRTIYAKPEMSNMTRSIKDRVALYTLEQAYLYGQIEPGFRIALASNGNIGLSFAAIGRALGHPVTIFMADWMNIERAQLLEILGATVIPVSDAHGGFFGCIEMAEKLAKRERTVFLPRPHSNKSTVLAHEETTGPEIIRQLSQNNVDIDAFVAGVGTGGTIVGIKNAFQREHVLANFFPVTASKMTIVTSSLISSHPIYGFADEAESEFLENSDLNDFITVDDGDAIIMAQKLAANLGLGVGISSGANFLGALKVQTELGSDSVVMTIFPDDNEKYLRSDLLREEPVKKSYLAPNVKLKNIRCYPRASEYSIE